MTQEQFNTAMSAIARHHSSQISINLPKNNFVGDLGNQKFTIHITRCVPGLVNDLLKLGYSLGMEEQGLCVTKI